MTTTGGMPYLETQPHPTPSPTPSMIIDMVAPKLLLVEEELRQNFRSEIRTIHDVGEHILDGGGKRLRPSLLLLASSMLGYEGTTDITYAAVVEFVHTATLVHDDIIDEAELRRGRTSINYQWGNHLTVLVGDYLYTHAMKMALSQKRLEVVELLCDTTILMTEGEILSLEKKGRVDLTSDEYFDIVGRKTAALFGASCRIPGFLVSTPPPLSKALYNYGFNLGICFQLIDDLLDFTSSAEVLGKPALQDLKEGKITLPLILSLTSATESERRTIQHVVRSAGATDGSLDREIGEIARKYGGIDRTYEIAREYGHRALGYLHELPDSPARDSLEAAVVFVLDRDH